MIGQKTSVWKRILSVLYPSVANDSVDIGTGTYLGGLVELKQDNILNVPTDGLILKNSTLSTLLAKVQMSGRLRWRANGWDDDDAVNRTVDWSMEVIPSSGNTVTSTLLIGTSLDGAGYTLPATLTNTGNLTISGSLNIGNGKQIANGTSANYFTIDVGGSASPAYWSRNTADTYTTAVINNLNASSTGHILDCQWQSVNRFIVFKEGGIQSNYNSAIAMGAVPDASAVLTVGWNNSTMAAGTTAARHLLVGGNITELAGAAITDIVGAYFNTFTITDGGAAETVGFTSTVYIANAPTVGTAPTIGNYALFVDAGEVRIDGDIGDTTYRVNKGWFTDLEATSSISTTQYFGDKTTDGSWKMEIESGDLVIYKKETGTWVEKGRYE